MSYADIAERVETLADIFYGEGYRGYLLEEAVLQEFPEDEHEFVLSVLESLA